MQRRITAAVAAVLVAAAAAAGCGGGEGAPPEGFDVTGTWSERGGGSTLVFDDTCGYSLRFSPPLSDGTATFGGERYERIDNATVGFTIVLGLGDIQVLDVEATIDGGEVLSFRLEDRSFKFEKTGGGGGAVPECPVREDGDAAPERIEVADVAVSGAGLPVMPLEAGADEAPGLPLPELRGIDFDGNPVEIVADGSAKLILVVAHWDPFGQGVIDDLAAWDGLPTDTDLYLLSTAVDPTRQNYPPSAWLLGSGVAAPVLVDDAEGSAADALGTMAFPFWVFVSADGTLAHRAAGDLEMDWLDALVAEHFG